MGLVLNIAFYGFIFVLSLFFQREQGRSPLATGLASIGVIVPLMTSEILGSVDRSYSGVASGTLNTARQTGSVIGVALFGSLIGAAGSSSPVLCTRRCSSALRCCWPQQLSRHGFRASKIPPVSRAPADSMPLGI